MKAISASIIVLAAAVLLAGGSFAKHDDSQLFVQAVGCLVGIIGLIAWLREFTNRNEKWCLPYRAFSQSCVACTSPLFRF